MKALKYSLILQKTVSLRLLQGQNETRLESSKPSVEGKMKNQKVKQLAGPQKKYSH